jgi:hypothetical protein
MRLRPTSLPATLAYTLVLAMGCAGGGSTTGTGGSSSSGSAGASNPGSAGTTATAGTTGSGGSASPGSGGTTGIGGTSSPGSAGSVSPGAAGSSSPGAAGTTSGAGGVSSNGGTGGASSAGNAGTTGAGGMTSGAAGTTGAGGTGGICQMAQLEYEPKIPTVYLVVDRSGSMFHCLTSSQPVCADKNNTSWTTLKNAVQAVIKPLEAQVRFGFTTIHGTNPAGGGMCPVMTAGTLTDNVAPALENADEIMAVYNGLVWPVEADSSATGKKFESPAMYSIKAATRALMNFTMPGDKYIIFITDGQEDFCDDALEICASDSTVGAIQAAFAANIRTIVLGLQTTQFNLPPGVLDAFANAGAGEPTVASLMSNLDTTAIFDQCQGVTPWRTDLTASGHPTTRGPTAVVGTYGTTAGPTKPFKPNAADQTMLSTQLSMALAGVKSCTFDLTDVGGKSIKVDTTKLNQAKVKIEGTEIPLSATNGWNVDVAAPTQLVFSGTACTTWRNPNSKKIDLEFPCGTIIFE